jgi:hypothetical protein
MVVKEFSQLKAQASATASLGESMSHFFGNHRNREKRGGPLAIPVSCVAEMDARNMAQGRKTSDANRQTRSLRMTESVYEAIRSTIGQRHAEQGGALGGNRETGEVTHFHFDGSARRTGATYSPDVEVLNRLLSEEWNPAGINLMGFVHSHPRSFAHPSSGDMFYARVILEANAEMDRLLLPIVMTAPDAGQFSLAPFAALRDRGDVRIEPLELEIIATRSNQLGHASETFTRVQNAYDLSRLAASRVIYVGTGGAVGFAEDMARAGVGLHVLIDPDVVSESNLATQQVYRKDIGRAKVECLSERILDINPQAHVLALQRPLDDLDDQTIREILTLPLDGHRTSQTLLCGFTDSFDAQARVNRISLNFGVPSLCAQLYHEGRAVEATFTYPGVTPACHRCALGSRYRAYLGGGFSNNVTSDGTPIFATTRLNALKGFIAMALLHHGTEHPRWGNLLSTIGNRSLVQVRLDPDIERTLGLKVFTNVFGQADPERVLFDEAVWLPQLPECPEQGFEECADCGGTGDLRRAVGTFADTRLMRC